MTFQCKKQSIFRHDKHPTIKQQIFDNKRLIISAYQFAFYY